MRSESSASGPTETIKTTTDPVRLTTVTNRNNDSHVDNPTTCTVTALPGAPG